MTSPDWEIARSALRTAALLWQVERVRGDSSHLVADMCFGCALKHVQAPLLHVLRLLHHNDNPTSRYAGVLLEAAAQPGPREACQVIFASMDHHPSMVGLAGIKPAQAIYLLELEGAERKREEARIGMELAEEFGWRSWLEPATP